jgi:hypothetical protein
MEYDRCPTKGCRGWSWYPGWSRMSEPDTPCGDCQCACYSCNIFTDEYSFCEKHRCKDDNCFRGGPYTEEYGGCNRYHLSMFADKVKCKLCNRLCCRGTPYCNQHACLRLTYNNRKYHFCKEPVKPGHQACNSCLKYCNEKCCEQLHAPGCSKCEFHFHCYRELKRKNYRCGSTECQICSVRRDFITNFLVLALECDIPIVEAVVEHSTFLKNKEQNRK